MKRIICSIQLLFISILLINSTASALSITDTQSITTDGGSANIDVSVTREAATFSVTLPTSFPVNISSTGEVITAPEVNMINNGGAEVLIKKIEIQSGTGWELKPYNASILNALPVNTKALGWQMTVGGESVSTQNSGTSEVLVENNPVYSGGMKIPSGNSIAINYNVLFPVFINTSKVVSQPATVIFTVGWNIAP